MFHRVVNAVEVLAAAGAVAFVILLFVNSSGGSGSSATTLSGAALFSQNCAGCHGAHGEGGVGPQLAGGAVVRDFPNAADQVTLVKNGRGIMPAFGTSLSAAQLQAVVQYTRTGLGH